MRWNMGGGWRANWIVFDESAHEERRMSRHSRAGRSERHLLCPRCDYDMTGLPSDTCPECGTTTNAEQFARWMGRTDVPATAWEEKPSVANYFVTFGHFALAPGEFVREYPGARPRMPALRFSLVSHAIVLWIFTVLGAVSGPRGSLPLVFWVLLLGAFSGLLVALGMFICEAVLGALLARFVPLNYARSSADAWVSVVHYGSSYGVLSAVAILGARLLLAAMGDESSDLDRVVAPLYCAVQVVLISCWSLTIITLAFRCRRKRSGVPSLVFIAIPLSVTVGLVVSSTAYFLIVRLVATLKTQFYL